MNIDNILKNTDEINKRVEDSLKKEELKPIDKLDVLLSKNLTKMELVEMRKARGLTQKDISIKTGLSPACISDIENMERGNPRMNNLIKYLECLGLEISFKQKTL